MRITEDTPQRLKLRDRTLWISAVCCAASAVLLASFVAAPDHLGLLAVSGLFFVFALGFLRTTDVTFDKARRTCDMRRVDVLRLTRTHLSFDDIVDIKVDIEPLQGELQVTACRLSLVTASAVLPLTASYEPSLERYNAMRDRILDVLFADGRRPPAADPVEALAREGRTIDAVAVLRKRERLTLTAARARVAEILKIKDVS